MIRKKGGFLSLRLYICYARLSASLSFQPRFSVLKNHDTKIYGSLFVVFQKTNALSPTKCLYITIIEIGGEVFLQKIYNLFSNISYLVENYSISRIEEGFYFIQIRKLAIQYILIYVDLGYFWQAFYVLQRNCHHAGNFKGHLGFFFKWQDCKCLTTKET